ncbi:MAG TPA: DUF6391 domain-containing protein [Anaerolineae bacterium]|nr:DUF6391 domain-containing protein [Anaerolineae bacterium]HQH37692.1 DUF6391 domain-containing protein [Anaerolineae bacterium]
MSVSLLTRTRRNHALEHATLNLVGLAYPNAQALGVSGPMGFTIYTSLTAEEIVPAAMEALKRLKAGEHALCIHKNCGTNLVITATLTAAPTLLGINSKATLRQRLERWPHFILLDVLALLIAPPVAEWIQAHLTTDPHVATLEIASIFTDHQGGLQRIRVRTRHV